MKDRSNLKLQTTIILFVCSVVLFAMFITHLLIGATVSNNAQSHLEEQTMMIARTVAKSQTVIEAMEGSLPEHEIQGYAEEIREISGVNFIVVFDSDGIRKSHPDPSKIGQSFVGGDEKKVLSGEEQISIAEGTLGMSLRAFTPIYSTTGEQLGAVSVGISLENVREAVADSRSIIYIGLILGSLVGIVGAVFLAKRIKKVLFGLEPSGIARVLEERNAMLQSMFEGVVAVDQNGQITLANSKARKLFQEANLTSDPIGQEFDSYIGNVQLSKVIKSGESVYNRDSVINGYHLLVNSVPLYVDGNIVGAIATFRDKTEVETLAEQLTGVRVYAGALRAQTHEFMNKLQVILGMVHMKYFDKLAPYINQITYHYQDEIGFISTKIKDPVLAGFILAKLSNAREQGIELTLSDETFIPEASDQEVTHEVVKIVGNLINNAFDAVEDSATKSVEVLMSYCEQEEQLTIKVSDTGSGMSEEVMNRIFDKGFSTKQEERGYGLYLLQQSLESLNGEMDILTKKNAGTSFHITLPYKSKDE
ncbi:DcuS/MalK family sensor histidine kinase [Desertibacillus haloalkaliphilus]|uniref:DcuS/MalK family sensor histidine kinase n=1 Tax=Desertibacillus haloalkaliphilus TaxID=1328930 RepID=UPI001C26CBCA|nr:DcuS/MalK family sensor histidine kinase [Desertibacillus haloalkaliphilus]MBU8906423.1 DcuS/MalK family sensor histidine kinase [Desertibacillus haloalkaliphilus]